MTIVNSFKKNFEKLETSVMFQKFLIFNVIFTLLLSLIKTTCILFKIPISVGFYQIFFVLYLFFSIYEMVFENIVVQLLVFFNNQKVQKFFTFLLNTVKNFSLLFPTNTLLLALIYFLVSFSLISSILISDRSTYIILLPVYYGFYVIRSLFLLPIISVILLSRIKMFNERVPFYRNFGTVAGEVTGFILHEARGRRWFGPLIPLLLFGIAVDRGAEAHKTNLVKDVDKTVALAKNQVCRDTAPKLDASLTEFHKKQFFMEDHQRKLQLYSRYDISYHDIRAKLTDSDTFRNLFQKEIDGYVEAGRKVFLSSSENTPYSVMEAKVYIFSFFRKLFWYFV